MDRHAEQQSRKLQVHLRGYYLGRGSCTQKGKAAQRKQKDQAQNTARPPGLCPPAGQ